MTIALILFISFFNASVEPQTWECRNDLEIRCDGKNCTSVKEGEFTPMGVSFDDKGTISVCAYSGCWEGTGSVLKSDGFLYLTGKALAFSTAKDSKQDISITLDTSDNIALLKAGEFSQPLVCKVH